MSWQSAGPEAMVLNVDGSLLSDPPREGFGGLVRDHLGQFVLGFYGYLGPTSILGAELHAILTGLRYVGTLTFGGCYVSLTLCLQCVWLMREPLPFTPLPMKLN